MRRAYSNVGWLQAETQAEPFGFSLGYDFCAEHEFGARYIKRELGVPQKSIPVGVEDRTMTAVPSTLHFAEYEHRSRDKRYRATLPAALLFLSNYFEFSEKPPARVDERAARLGAQFFTDFKADKHYKPERDDIASAWSTHSGFAIHVRGEENVRHLKSLYEAFLRCGVSVADATIVGFERKALALVFNDRLDPRVCETVRENDEAFLRLQQAADGTGIKERLEAAGKGWYALTPMWREEEGSQLLFCLNPREQRRYASGWFTLEDLQAWAEDKGPVADSQAISATLKARDKEWSFHLHQGFTSADVSLRVFESFVWMDDQKTVPGARLLIARGNDELPGDGVYPVEMLEQYVELGRQEYAKRRAAREAIAAPTAAGRAKPVTDDSRALSGSL